MCLRVCENVYVVRARAPREEKFPFIGRIDLVSNARRCYKFNVDQRLREFQEVNFTMQKVLNLRVCEIPFPRTLQFNQELQYSYKVHVFWI